MTTPHKIKIAALIAALISSATITNGYANPYQAGSQQWHDYNAMGYMMMQEMNERTAAAQRQAAARRAQAAAQPRKQWYAIDGHIVFAVSFDNSATPGNAEKPGYVASQEGADLAMAEERVQLRCLPDSDCQIFFAVSNMCGAVAQGYLRNGRGTRIYPSGATAYDETQAEELALANCRADSAVNPASCAVEVSRCGQTKEVYE